MSREEQKRAAAEAALAYVTPHAIVGVGTGSTAGFFIAALAARPDLIGGAVASSEASAAALRAAAITVVGLREAAPLPLYVDGADAVDPRLRLIKGAGGALAREKVVAAAAELFVCIVDETKLVERLGGGSCAEAAATGGHIAAAAVPLAVLPMAVPLVSERVRALGGSPVPRPDYLSDDDAAIVDVSGLDLSDPERLEAELDSIPGVVECGIFARRRADVVLAGTGAGVRTFTGPPK
jgi:ribose 5-phosphate isomerase A